MRKESFICMVRCTIGLHLRHKGTHTQMADYWQQPDTKLVHLSARTISCSIVSFSLAMLKAHGHYVLPDNVPANEFLNIEGEKVSTSRNWAVWGT